MAPLFIVIIIIFFLGDTIGGCIVGVVKYILIGIGIAIGIKLMGGL